MSVPIVCETPGCVRNGECFNRISGIPSEEIEAFYESWRGDPEDHCPTCGELGIAHDPEDDND